MVITYQCTCICDIHRVLGYIDPLRPSPCLSAKPKIYFKCLSTNFLHSLTQSPFFADININTSEIHALDVLSQTLRDPDFNLRYMGSEPVELEVLPRPVAELNCTLARRYLVKLVWIQYMLV